MRYSASRNKGGDMRGQGLAGVVVLLGCAWATVGQAGVDAGPIEVTVDASKTAPPIGKYEYGMFIEPIGQLVARGLWAEMLDDRKFYFAIDSTSPDIPPGTNPRFRRMALRKWRPIGPDSAVTMDTEHAFTGEQSPRIDAAAGEAHGIQQAGLALRKGKQYQGHIVLRGGEGVRVQVALVWGEGKGDRATVTIPGWRNTYTVFPLRFTAQADTDNGRIEIFGTGKGNFEIGTVSLMPADNLEGFRRDTITLLRQLNSGFWRLPGGNFISNFNWYDSVGDRDKRPPTFDHAWNAMQTNDVGMDEYMTLCRLIGVDPYITVNAGFGDAHSAGELVEYMNGSAQTRLGALRAHNGHPQPYGVKFWDIGNEPYGTWQLGRTDLKYFVLKHNEFARAMRKADPTITLLASGAMPDEMTIEGMTRAMHLENLQAQFGGPADWTGGLIKNCWGNFDGITEHWYSRAGKRFDLEHAKNDPVQQGIETGYVPADETVLEWVRHPSNRVHLKAQEWEEYERLFPEMEKKRTFLSIDEWAYTGTPTNLKLALAYGMVLNEMIRHTDFLKMAAFTTGLSTLDYNATDATMNTNGLLFKMYREHLGSIPVALSGNAPQPAPKYPPGGDQPETNAGSPTYPLDMVATLTSDGKFLTVAMVNATDSAQAIDLQVEGVRIGGKATLWQMTGANLDAADRLGQEPEVEVKEIALQSAPTTFSVAPISIDIYRFPVER
jgi:alpha-L-arabinofuranosidase